MLGMPVHHDRDVEYRHALARLAASPTGIPEDVLIAQGISAELIIDLMRGAHVERVIVNGRAAMRDFIRITDAGWRLLVSQ